MFHRSEKDGVAYGTPTWIWSVVVDDALFYLRAYNGQELRWYQAAMQQKTGRITAAGLTKEVTFEPVDGLINDRINEAYRAKFRDSPNPSPMIGARAPFRHRQDRAPGDDAAPHKFGGRSMRATVMHAAGDVRIENVPDARIVEPSDAVIRVTRACICGSDLWPYRSMERSEQGQRMGHEAIGVVEAVGRDVRTVKRGNVVVMPFASSDGTCVSVKKA